MIELEQDGMRWEVRPGFQSLLPRVLAAHAQSGQRLSDPATESQDEEARRYTVKRHRSGLSARLKTMLGRRSPARLEWETAQALERLEIPIVRPMALGENSGESVLIAEPFDGRPLDEAATECPDALYDFFNRLYRRGVALREPQPEDVLVRHGPLDIRLANFGKVVIGASVSEPDRLRQLTFLKAFLPLKVPRPVAREGEAFRREYLYGKARACLEGGREFGLRKCGQLSWRVRLAALTPEAESILQAPDQFLERDAWVLQPGEKSFVGGAPGLVLKRFEQVDIRGDDLRGLTPADRVLFVGRYLEMAGVPTPQVLAAADDARSRSRRRTFLLMREIRDGKNLRQWRGDASLALRQVAEVVGGLHRAGFLHENLKETNFVLKGDGRAHFVGFAGLRRVRKVVAELALTDLDRLAQRTARLRELSQLDRLVFLHAYCRASGLRPGDLQRGTWRVKSLVAVRRQSGGGLTGSPAISTGRD